MDPKVPAAPHTLGCANPFGAPVYYRETVDSTMDAARALAGLPEPAAPHGTVLAAGYQSAGRGRAGRPWNMGRGESLPLTLILRYPAVTAIPPCLTLRTGLALSLAIEDFVDDFAGTAGPLAIRPVPLAGRVQVKWPNDIMLIQNNGRGKKAAGILAEAAGFSGDSGGTVYLGMGINIAQTEFPPDIEKKACSIAGTLYPENPPPAAFCTARGESRFILLEKILARLYAELENPGPEKTAADTSWREQLLERLYMRGKPVRFFPGAAGSPDAVEGTLAGIGGAGELVITVDGEDRPFITGELAVYKEF
jgi:BirA family biotin operon repressor/biotin-[acetyl-CoA-carboxylase] ligase